MCYPRLSCPTSQGHLNVLYPALRALWWEFLKGTTLSQDPFFSSVGNYQRLELEISYSTSKAPSFKISGVPRSGYELYPSLRVGEEGCVSFLVPGCWLSVPPQQTLLVGHTRPQSLVVRLSPKNMSSPFADLCLRGQC